MIEVGFDCNQQITKVQGNLDDPFKISINKFLQKSSLEPDNVFFIVNGKPINFEEKIEKQISKMNKENKKCKVLVQLLESTPIIPKYEKSKDIICPKCYEPCRIKNQNFHISLFGCINNHTNTYKIKDFFDSQEINISSIKCEKCNLKNKSDYSNNEFYKCLTCNINLCLLCKTVHPLNHNIKEIHTKSNIKPKTRSKISNLLNPTNSNNNISHLSRAKTTINNIDSNKYEKFNIQSQRYNFQKTYLYLHPDINNSFIKRMEFDVYKRHIKEKEINKLIEINKLKIEEEERNKTFNRLINDANRRNEAMDNLEKVKNILNNNNIIEEPSKKYSDEQWKKIYEERFKKYLEKINQKKEKKIKSKLESEIKKENEEISLCKVKKASRKHIEKESNKMYKEAMKRTMKKKEKLMKLKNNKYNYEIEDEFELENNKKRYTKKIKESPYNFKDDEFSNNKSIDISNYILEKISSFVPSNQESKNIEKIIDNSSYENNKNNINKKEKTKNNNNNENEKKIKHNFFEEEQKDQNIKKDINLLNNKDNLYNNFLYDKMDNISNSEDVDENIYHNEVRYIIDQFFLRNKDD
mgnify:CR=1 FL=1